MRPRSHGWYDVRVDALRPEARYLFDVDGALVQDPASRSQPDGVDGWSEVVDHDAHVWDEGGWSGRPWTETVLYEMHVGTFSPEGTFAGAAARLDHLRDLGVTMVELMPVGAFPGRWNWGYDGVLPFAPSETYGSPDDLKRLVEACHRRGMSIILDVVINHFGPLSNHLFAYAPGFATDRHETPWGAAIDFDGPHSHAVRSYFVENALQWIVDYRFDGLRLDAVQAVFDDGPEHILEQLARRAREAVAARPVHLILENDRNEARWLRRRGRDDLVDYAAQWDDDIHHALRVLVSGRSDGYYADYAEAPLHHLGRALAEGFSYQGEESKDRPGLRRGTPSKDLAPTSFVAFLQNHDQVGNSAFGRRVTAEAPEDALRLATALLLLAPTVPLLFMGQEWASARPFDFFCDFPQPLADAVRKGRREEARHLPERVGPADLEMCMRDPNSVAARDASILDWDAVAHPPHAAALVLHRRLLAIRARVVVPLLQAIQGGSGSFLAIPRNHPTGAADEGAGIEVRWRLADGRTYVLAANFTAEPACWIDPGGETLFHLVDDAPSGALASWDLIAKVMPFRPSGSFPDTAT